MINKILYIFRHGETDYNKNGFAKNAFDIDLNENGIVQANLLAEKLANKNIEIIHTSPLIRAKHTATIVAKKLNVEIIENDFLKEINYGDYTGLSEKKLNEIYKNQYGENFVKNIWKSLDKKYDNFSFPNGETKVKARNRILNTIINICSNTDKNIIAVSTHGGIMKYLLFAITSKKFHLDNCDIVKIEYNYNKKELLYREHICSISFFP